MDEPNFEMTFKISLENVNKLDKVAKETEISFDEVVNRGIEAVYDIIIERFELY